MRAPTLLVSRFYGGFLKIYYAGACGPGEDSLCTWRTLEQTKRQLTKLFPENEVLYWEHDTRAQSRVEEESRKLNDALSIFRYPRRGESWDVEPTFISCHSIDELLRDLTVGGFLVEEVINGTSRLLMAAPHETKVQFRKRQEREAALWSMKETLEGQALICAATHRYYRPRPQEVLSSYEIEAPVPFTIDSLEEVWSRLGLIPEKTVSSLEEIRRYEGDTRRLILQPALGYYTPATLAATATPAN